MAPAPSKPIVARETKWKRALRALPLLFIFYAADRTFGTSLRMLEPLISSDGTRLDLGDGVVVPFCSGYFGLPALDGIISMFTAFFAPSIGGFDKVGRVQAIAFLADLVPMQIIWMVEGSRVSNSRALTSRLYFILYTGA
jgi:hypothetical protein